MVQRYQGYVANVYYRLGRDVARVRRGGEDHDGVPADIEARFRALHQAATDCNALVCSATRVFTYGLGNLDTIFLAPQWLEPGPDWTGNAVPLVTADQGPADALTTLAVYLTCGYDAIDRSDSGY